MTPLRFQRRGRKCFHLRGRFYWPEQQTKRSSSLLRTCKAGGDELAVRLPAKGSDLNSHQGCDGKQLRCARLHTHAKGSTHTSSSQLCAQSRCQLSLCTHSCLRAKDKQDVT